MNVGLIGLGLMGSAIATRLASEGPLHVWNRTPAAMIPLVKAGAVPAESAADLFSSCETVVMMVSDEHAIDDVLSTVELGGRTLVQMSTVRPSYSQSLSQRVTSAGGRYVEAPVSGSRQPALEGQLVGMLAGEPGVLDDVERLLTPVCATIVRCGAPPQAMEMKLAVNTFLITVVTGLAEAFHFAETHRLDSRLLDQILGTGPMSSFVSRAKAAAIVSGDFSPQAAIPDVLKNARLVVESAADHGAASTLMDACAALYAETSSLGHGREDMAAVIFAYRNRTEEIRRG